MPRIARHLLTPRFLPIAALAALVFAALSPSLAEAQGPITSGQTVTGSISPVGDSDTWTFTANTGDRIVARVGEISQTGNFQPRVRLFGPGATLIASSFGVAAAEVADTAATSGAYTVVVDDVNGVSATGTYRLSFVKTGSAVVVSPGDEGGPMTNGVMHTGTIDVGDLDVWTISANAGDAIVVRMGETSATNLAPYLRIYAPNGTLATPGTSGVSATEVAVTATTTGTYLVVAGDFASGFSGSGAYRLTLAKTGSPVVVSPSDEGGPMTNGVMHTGTIDVGDLDVWTVDATAGDAIVVRMGDTGATNLAPYLRIYAPNGTLATPATFGVSATEVATTATTTGTYLVVAGDFASGFSGSGAYRLTLAKTGSAVVVSPGDEGGPMTNGVMHTGTIDVGDLDVWTVDATAGDAIVVRMGETSATSLAPYLRIYAPNGTLLDSGSGVSATEVTVTAATTGTYLMVASDFASGFSGSGAYRLTLAKTGSPVVVSASDEGGPMTNGVMHTGTIDVGDLDLWTISANAGDAIVVRMGETSATNLAPYLRIYAPNGTLATPGTSGVSATEVAVTATTTGTYLVVAGDFASGFSGSGAYRLTLAKTGSPVVVSPSDEGGPMTNGVMHTGTIDVGDLDLWTISANAGDAIVLRMGESSATNLAPYLRIYAPNGTLATPGTSGVSATEVAVTATTTGTYLVVAGDFASGFSGSGAYRLTLAKTGSAVVVSPGDEGGPVGWLSTGVIDVGDLDVWTVAATAGQNIVVNMIEAVSGSSLAPYLRLYSPAGGLLASNSGTTRAQVSATAAGAGTYLVVAGDFASGFSGSGPYRLAPSATTDAEDGPRSFEMAFASAPNPCVAHATLRYQLPREAATAVRLFDSQGRLVRDLVNRVEAAGEHEAVWDGRDASGALVGPGIYLARLDSGGRSMVRKVAFSR